jgi:hypothetical protein
MEPSINEKMGRSRILSWIVPENYFQPTSTQIMYRTCHDIIKYEKTIKDVDEENITSGM